MTTQTVTFGAGCFWGVEYVFRRVPVTAAQVGYAGGITPNPTYREVCSHTTGHAEVLQVQFDDEQVSFEQLLEVFWAMHDPTQVNRQGPDVGDQYRSASIRPPTSSWPPRTHRRKARRSGSIASIATEIRPAPEFYPAEDYHQAYYEKNGHTPYCHVVPVKVLEEQGLPSLAADRERRRPRHRAPR